MTGVLVTATGNDGSKFRTLTNLAGLYQFPALRAGSYTLRFEISGFSPAERTVSLLVGQTVSVDLALDVAQTKSSVKWKPPRPKSTLPAPASPEMSALPKYRRYR
jgi:hypothetical protein